jgi:predicted flap endonuclease-1-like 5' DNA nuclease
MLHIFLQAAQTTKGAAIEILAMLVVAAAIGSITVYYYWKSIYNKKIAEKDEIISSREEHINQLVLTTQDQKKEIEATASNLKGKEDELASLGKKYSQLEAEAKKHLAEITNLKGMYDEAVKETDVLKEQLKGKDQKLMEADEVIARIAERKHLLDYDSFGKATIEEKDDLMMISGIGPFIEQRLQALDIYTFKQIGEFTKKDIHAVNEAIEYFPGRIERDEWVAQAKELVYSNGEKTDLLEKIRARKDLINYDRIGIAHKEEANDLSIISGIGGWIQQKLNALDIFTFRQIANFIKEDEISITSAVEFFPGRIDRDEWVPQAQELVHSGGKRTALFERLKRRKHKIDYSKIGLAHPDESDDLTEINGIGGFIHEKLNVLDIYTYAQISKFTDQDIKTVTEIIEYFPGRIKRDKWVGQAKTLIKQGKLDLKFEK